MQAPTFSLLDQDGKILSLVNYRGKWVVVYFYPKDDTPGCTKEACAFRDTIDVFTREGIVVLGISKDNVTSHKKFQKKYHLPFTLLSDPTTATMQAYGVWGLKKFMGRKFMGTFRKTFIIGPDGEIKKNYEKVDVLIHAQEIVNDIRILKG